MADEITLERDIEEILGGPQAAEAANHDVTQAPAAEPGDDEESDEESGEDEDED